MTYSKKRLLLITIPFVILSLVHLHFCCNGPHMARAITKALPIGVLLIGMCIWGRKQPNMIHALFFCILGDLSTEVGLSYPLYFQCTFFAVGQFFYIKEFLRYRPKRPTNSGQFLSLAPLFCGVYALFLLNNLISSCLQERPNKRVFVTGSTLFVISDSLILVNILLQGFDHSSLMIMSTYYAAQYLINILPICEKD